MKTALIRDCAGVKLVPKLISSVLLTGQYATWTDSLPPWSRARSAKQMIVNFGNTRYFVARSASGLRGAGAVDEAALHDEPWVRLDQTEIMMILLSVRATSASSSTLVSMLLIIMSTSAAAGTRSACTRSMPLQSRSRTITPPLAFGMPRLWTLSATSRLHQSPIRLRLTTTLCGVDPVFGDRPLTGDGVDDSGAPVAVQVNWLSFSLSTSTADLHQMLFDKDEEYQK
ncbi:hypothetical protein C7999DRAFT_32778 [Corynascus novoguineensis]|uniref:Uncharacterized protein n=1 Tax=Corynascus novoguineensis TaxID=1126955 RepID=A0AAN7CT22_9PEZI|nr:hypothetical protein C7999DRAFT_32778 [Corynascus novoguineensis]